MDLRRRLDLRVGRQASLEGAGRAGERILGVLVVDIGGRASLAAEVDLTAIVADAKGGIFEEFPEAIVVQSFDKVVERRSLEIPAKDRFDGVHVDDDLISGLIPANMSCQ